MSSTTEIYAIPSSKIDGVQQAVLAGTGAVVLTDSSMSVSTSSFKSFAEDLASMAESLGKESELGLKTERILSLILATDGQGFRRDLDGDNEELYGEIPRIMASWSPGVVKHIATCYKEIDLDDYEEVFDQAFNPSSFYAFFYYADDLFSFFQEADRMGDWVVASSD